MYLPSGEATAPILFGSCRRGSLAPGAGVGGGAGPIRIPVPPFLSYIHNENAPMRPSALDAIVYWPSAGQEGEQKDWLRPVVSALGLVPSALAIHTFSAPPRSLKKAIIFPSGENLGWLSNDIPPTIRLASPPATG